jgi:hypothetical protein
MNERDLKGMFRTGRIGNGGRTAGGKGRLKDIQNKGWRYGKTGRHEWREILWIT